MESDANGGGKWDSGAEPPSGLAESDELRQLRSALAETTARLEQLQRQKSSILAMAVHDLRTPLAIIQGYTQLLAADLPPETNPSTGEYISNILAHADSLGKMVENLLALDQLERGDLRLAPRRHNLGELIDNALAQVESLSAVKALSFRQHATPSNAFVDVDESQVNRALYNLLSHVIKYARPNSQVGIDVLHDSEFWQLLFIDPLRALPAEAIARLFDLADPGKGDLSSLRGMDMGLILARHIAELHGGRMRAFSRQEQGLVIALYLPASKQRT